MIRVLVLPEGGDPKSSEGIEAANAAVERWRSGGDRIWIDLEAPAHEELAFLRDRLVFDPLSIDDVARADHPPKVDEVGALGDRAAYLLVIARAPIVNGAARSEGVSLLLRSRMLVTAHASPSHAVEAVRALIARDPARTMGRGIEFVAHAVLDRLVSAYQPLLDDFERCIETLEEAILDDDPEGDFEKILDLRRSVAAALRDTRPMRDVALSLAREGHPSIKPAARLAFRDLYDHLLRVHDLLESHRDTVASIRDAYLAMVNNRMNDVMKRLTVVAVISGTLAVVTGLFGMNVAGIPGASAPWGFAVTTAATLALALGILALFRWKRWV